MLCMQSTILCIACLPKDKRNKRYNPCVPSKNAKYPCWWPYQLVTLWKVVQTTVRQSLRVPSCWPTPVRLLRAKGHTRTLIVSGGRIALLIVSGGTHPYAYCLARKAFTRSQVAYHARRFTILCIGTWPCERLCILRTQSRALHARRFRVVGWLIVSQPTRTTQSLCCASFARKKVG